MSSSLKNINCEYQHYISSINGSISIDINIFGGENQKSPGVECKWGTISKKD